LSLGGIQVVSDKPLQPGTILELELVIPGTGLFERSRKLFGAGRIPSPRGGINSGIQFIPVYEEDLMKLKEYLKAGG